MQINKIHKYVCPAFPKQIVQSEGQKGIGLNKEEQRIHRLLYRLPSWKEFFILTLKHIRNYVERTFINEIPRQRRKNMIKVIQKSLMTVDVKTNCTWMLCHWKIACILIHPFSIVHQRAWETILTRGKWVPLMNTICFFKNSKRFSVIYIRREKGKKKKIKASYRTSGHVYGYEYSMKYPN